MNQNESTAGCCWCCWSDADEGRARGRRRWRGRDGWEMVARGDGRAAGAAAAALWSQKKEKQKQQKHALVEEGRESNTKTVLFSGRGPLADTG